MTTLSDQVAELEMQLTTARADLEEAERQRDEALDSRLSTDALPYDLPPRAHTTGWVVWTSNNCRFVRLEAADEWRAEAARLEAELATSSERIRNLVNSVEAANQLAAHHQAIAAELRQQLEDSAKPAAAQDPAVVSLAEYRENGRPTEAPERTRLKEVEGQRRAWQSRADAAQAEVAKLTAELATLRQQLADLTSANHQAAREVADWARKCGELKDATKPDADDLYLRIRELETRLAGANDRIEDLKGDLQVAESVSEKNGTDCAYYAGQCEELRKQLKDAGKPTRPAFAPCVSCDYRTNRTANLCSDCEAAVRIERDTASELWKAREERDAAKTTLAERERELAEANRKLTETAVKLGKEHSEVERLTGELARCAAGPLHPIVELPPGPGVYLLETEWSLSEGFRPLSTGRKDQPRWAALRPVQDAQSHAPTGARRGR